MRKITQFHDRDKPDPDNLLLAFDISKQYLDLYSRYRLDGNEFEMAESFPNDRATISDRFDTYDKQARGLGYKGLSVVLEPSGRYENKLTQIALQRGYSIWTVNPERMYKAGVVYYGDDSKTDPLDGPVIYMMARMGKVSRLVPLPAEWQRLRHLGQWLDDCTQAVSTTRIRIGGLRQELFLDYDQRSSLTWGATGQAIQTLYDFDPWKITRGSYNRFIAEVKAHRTSIPERCLARIWRQAQSSCTAPLSADQRQLMAEQLNHLWRIWSDYDNHKQHLERQMIEIVDELGPDHWIPPLFGGFSPRMRAKILGETGPLHCFPHWRALVAYAGLKVRMRRSGAYRGKDKITKKGRILLRKHVGQAAFSLLRKDRILGPYYHRKLDEGMPAGKAKVACMRKLMKILYGAAKSQDTFNPQRVYRCAG